VVIVSYHHESLTSIKKYAIRYKKYIFVLSAAQIRAGRALVDWTGAKLAEISGLSLQTIRRMEGPVGPGRSSVVNVQAVRRALEGAGVEFLDADEANRFGPGVRLRPQAPNSES